MAQLDSILKGKKPMSSAKKSRKFLVWLEKSWLIIFSIAAVLGVSFVMGRFYAESNFSDCDSMAFNALIRPCQAGRDFVFDLTKSVASLVEPPRLVPKISSVFVDSDKKELIIQGQNLRTVEIFVKTKNAERFWGEAVNSNLKSNFETWSFKFPSEPILVEEIIVKAKPKDEREKEIASSLPLVGGAAVYQLVWGLDDVSVFGVDFGVRQKLFSGQTAILSSGEMGVRFKEIVSDSRCPIGVYCFWQGKVSAKFNLYFFNQLPLEIVLSLDPQNSESSSFEALPGLTIRLVSVGPELTSGKTELAPSDYYVVIFFENK